jgi:drug/metabolite transporter (DMT)-like permease
VVDNTRRAELLLVGVTLLWAGTFLFIKRALEWCDPFTLVTLRFALATVAAFVVWGTAASRVWTDRVLLRHALVLGLAYGTGFYLQTWGLLHTTIARSAFYTGTFVVFVPLMQRFVWRRHPTVREWWGVVLGITGVALLSNPDADSFNRGDLATLAGALVWSYYMGYLSYSGIERLGRLGTGALVILQCAVTTILGVLWYIATTVFPAGTNKVGGIVRVVWNVDVVVAVLYTSLLASVVATYVQTRLQPGVSATRVALIFALEPVFATALGIVAHGERLTLVETIGAAMIVAAAVLPAVVQLVNER